MSQNDEMPPLDILYFVQLPPPIHGVSVLNQKVTTSPAINRGWKTAILEIRFSNQIGQVNKVSLRKLVSMVGLLFRLGRLCRTRRPRCAYFTFSPLGAGFLRDLCFLTVMKAFKVTPVLHLHRKGIAAVQSRFLLSLYRYALRGSYVLHGSPGLLKAEITRVLDIKERGIIVANGTDDCYSSLNRTVDPTAPPRLLFCSSLFRSKGIFVLLEALRAIESPFALDVVGSFPDEGAREALVKATAEGGLQERIRFLGHLPEHEKQEAYRQASIFVHPTLDDTFPLVILEAMAAGLPVVATKEGAIPEIIRPNETGVLVERGDAIALARGLETLLGDPERAREMGLQARQDYLQRYTSACFETRMRTALEEILSGQGPGGSPQARKDAAPW